MSGIVVTGGFYDRVLNRGETPAQAIAAQPQWKPFWYGAPTRQYGRPMRYYQQLQALDFDVFAAARVIADWIRRR